MASKTTNYGLNKHSPQDFYNVEARNENWDKIDEALAATDPTKIIAKTEPADGDGVMIADSADGGKAKRLLWSNVKAALGKLFVPLARKINGKALSADITLTASDVGAAASDHNHDTRYYTQAQIDTKMSNAGENTVSEHNRSTNAHSALFAKKQDKLTGAAGKLVGFTSKDTVGPVDAPSGIDAVHSAPSTAAQDSLSVDPDGIAYTGNSSGAAVMQYGAANVTISDSEPSETLPEGHIWMVYE